MQERSTNWRWTPLSTPSTLSSNAESAMQTPALSLAQFEGLWSSMPTTRPIAAQGRPRITGNKPAALGSQLGCSPRQQLSPRISRPQLLRFLVVSSKTCWARSNESCSRLTVWPLVRFLEPACQSCPGQIRSSVFLVGRRGMRSGCPKRGRTSSAPRGPARSGARSVRDATHPHSIPPPSSSSSHSLNRR